jgi:hypothetical protein
LLQRRAEMLLKYADLDGAWEEEDAEGDSG